MRQIHVRFLLVLSLVLPLASVSVVVFPVEVLALGGICGGVTPCECGDTLVASRTLVNGVDPITTTVCPGNGLIVEASLLNLGGNTIRGNGTSAGVGVQIVFSGGITITGGTITRFGIGVLGFDTAGNHFTGLQLLTNVNSGLVLSEANGNVIERNVVSRMVCGQRGISVGGGENEIKLNRVEFNHFTGVAPVGINVQLDEVFGNTISRNIVRQNKRCGSTPVVGIAIFDNDATVELNRSEDNDGDGFTIDSFDGLPGIKVVRNIAVRNEQNGFRVSATSSHFDRNLSHYNGRPTSGFGIEDSSSGTGTGGTANTYADNLCAGNGLGDSSPVGLCR